MYVSTALCVSRAVYVSKAVCVSRAVYVSKAVCMSAEQCVSVEHCVSSDDDNAESCAVADDFFKHPFLLPASDESKLR